MVDLILLALEQNPEAPAKSLPGRYLVLGLILCIVLIYLILVVLAMFSKSVRQFLEFFGFKLPLGRHRSPPRTPEAPK